MNHPVTAPERVIGAGAADDLAALLDRHQLGKKLLLVCDDETWKVLGERVLQRHEASYHIERHSLGRYPKAELKLARQAIAAASTADGLIAVGAGTVNDIAKYAASELRKPYLAIATAASMNGYSSATASLEEHQFKQSYPAIPARAVVADITVIMNAPKRLSRAGLADTLARSTVEADCLLSHHLFGTPYPKEAFDCLRTHEPTLLNDAIKLTGNDESYMHCLTNALLDAGDWMARTGSSAIASQGEHMIAHTAEMLYEPELRYVYHGELVGIATIALSHLQQKLLVGTVEVKSLPREEGKFQRIFGKQRGPILAQHYARKVISENDVKDLNRRLTAEWPAIKSSIMKIMKSPLTLERAFLQAHLPVLPAGIKLDQEHFASALSYAYLSRDRFSFLDLAAMVGKRI